MKQYLDIIVLQSNKAHPDGVAVSGLVSSTQVWPARVIHGEFHSLLGLTISDHLVATHHISPGERGDIIYIPIDYRPQLSRSQGQYLHIITYNNDKLYNKLTKVLLYVGQSVPEPLEDAVLHSDGQDSQHDQPRSYVVRGVGRSAEQLNLVM